MTDENKDIRLALKRAMAYGKKRGLSTEQAEDLAQRWVITRFVNRSNQTLQQAYIDFLRIEFGDQRTFAGALKSMSKRSGEGDTGRGLEERAASPGENHRYADRYDRGNKRRKQLKLLNAKEAWIVEQIRLGFSTKEIGKFLGVSESRISQMKATITDKMAIVDLDKKIHVNWIVL